MFDIIIVILMVITAMAIIKFLAKLVEAFISALTTVFSVIGAAAVIGGIVYIVTNYL